MPRLHNALRLSAAMLAGLTGMLVVSCSENAANKSPATASDQAQPAAPEAVAGQDIITTARRADDWAAKSENRAAVAAVAPPQFEVAPAPPPPPVMAMDKRMGYSRVAGNYGGGDVWAPPPYHDVGRDKFTSVSENPFKIVREEPVSTFSIDVDTASYSFVRASLNRNVLPQPAAVRTEELVNYFPYSYAAPRSAEQPFSTNVSVFPSPWTPGRKLVRIGIRGYAIQHATRPRANLVFLIDTSGSMNEPNKLPLVKQSLSMLVNQLDANDRVSIVTYAGYAGTALAPTRASNREKILAVIDGFSPSWLNYKSIKTAP